MRPLQQPPAPGPGATRTVYLAISQVFVGAGLCDFGQLPSNGATVRETWLRPLRLLLPTVVPARFLCRRVLCSHSAWARRLPV
jgi:hypothetical protein